VADVLSPFMLKIRNLLKKESSQPKELASPEVAVDTQHLSQPESSPPARKGKAKEQA
jgi:hypothetical protein